MRHMAGGRSKSSWRRVGVELASAAGWQTTLTASKYTFVSPEKLVQDFLREARRADDELEALFERPVDLIADGAVRNPYVLASMQSDRQILYSA